MPYADQYERQRPAPRPWLRRVKALLFGLYLLALPFVLDWCTFHW